jgi:hypothetical protein
MPPENVEQRVERLRELLAKAGEIAQGVVRKLFPDGIWLYPDPEGGRHLWAYAQTATDRLTAAFRATRTGRTRTRAGT